MPSGLREVPRCLGERLPVCLTGHGGVIIRWSPNRGYSIEVI